MIKSRLIIVSNRLPIVLKKNKESWSAERGKGGLVTAMAPVLQNRGGKWIGWSGLTDDQGLSEKEVKDLLIEEGLEKGYSFEPVNLTVQEKKQFYEGFSNEIIWPLFHDLPSKCYFSPDYWNIYLNVNKKFSEKILENINNDDFIWVHDYHLMNIANYLKAENIQNKIGFFLHIPFPSLDIFMKLPWRYEILDALLDFDLLGFQTPRDKRNFIHCVKTIFKKEVKTSGKGNIVKIFKDKKIIKTGSFPISIDFNSFSIPADSKLIADKAWFLHENLPETKIYLGVDRLDYTKGIPLKMQAFRKALQKYPELRNKISLIQIIVPSRENIVKYAELKHEIEKLVGEINGEFTELGWVPIYYIYRNHSLEDLLAYYRTAEIALVTPLKDGMNLVAKEFCAASVDNNSILILSEFAGASAQLSKNSINVNPNNIEQVADAIHRAYYFDQQEKEKRIKNLRRSIKQYNIFWWVDTFLKTAISKSMDEFMPAEFDFDYTNNKNQ